MATWRELGQANARAAAVLVRDTLACRAAVSRAYYAVYHEVAHQIVGRGHTDFGRFNNPTHESLAKLARNNLGHLSEFRRRELEQVIRRLRRRREDADYRPAVTVDIETARGALRDMSEARRILGVGPFGRG